MIKVMINVDESLFMHGSMAHLLYEARKYDDILYIVADVKQPYCPIKIVCKPNYSVEQVKQFIDKTMLVSMEYEVVVENNFNLCD